MTKKGMVGMVIFSSIIAVSIAIIFTALFDNLYKIPDNGYVLLVELLVASILTSLIVVGSYTYWLKGRVDWIYY